MSEWPDPGNILRTTRESLGWTLADVSHRTRIPHAILCLLEANDHSKFPSTAYARSFLLQYCEYLGIDPIHFLDRFEPGDALAALENADSLKDHDEQVDALPIIIKRPKRPRKRARKVRKASIAREEKKPTPTPAPTSPSHSQQPLLVFSITVLLIAGALFGFMKLSDSFGGSETASEREPAEALGSIDGVTTQTPIGPDLSGVPRALPVSPEREENLVAGTPGRAGGTEALSSAPSTPGDASPSFSLENPPPRAVIVEE